MRSALRAVEIVVDELVLRGVAHEQADAVAAAFGSRLASLAHATDASVAARSEAFLRAPSIDAPAGSPAALGDALAGAVWGAVSRGGLP